MIFIQKKLIAMFVFLALALIGTGYYYLYGMTTIQGNLNINKIDIVNKLYSYNVYSDFYFRAAKYDLEGSKISEYSELQPIKTSIGYNLDKNNAQLILRSTLNGNKIILSDNNGINLKRDIDILNSFEKDFGKIVATQDKEYIQKSFKHTQETLVQLYDIKKELDNKTADSFYHEIKELPIANMRVRYYQLDTINNNLKGKIKVCPKDKWQPNILEWNFGESNRIYLQYLSKFENNDLDSYLKKLSKDKKTIIRLVKINNNTLQKMYLIKDSDENKIKTLFMDEHGYIYVLIFKADNYKSFEKYMSDYLKITYGIYFVDTPNFKNLFATEQDKKITTLEELNNILICEKIVDKDLDIDDDILNYFSMNKNTQKIVTIKNITEDSINCEDYIDKSSLSDDALIAFGVTSLVDPTLIGTAIVGAGYLSTLAYDKTTNYLDGKDNNKIKNQSKQENFSVAFEYIKEVFGNYPEEKHLTEIDNRIKNKKLIGEAIKNLDSVFTFTIGQKKLKELCPNGNISCVQNLKNKNWEY